MQQILQKSVETKEKTTTGQKSMGAALTPYQQKDDKRCCVQAGRSDMPAVEFRHSCCLLTTDVFNEKLGLPAAYAAV